MCLIKIIYRVSVRGLLSRIYVLFSSNTGFYSGIGIRSLMYERLSFVGCGVQNRLQNVAHNIYWIIFIYIGVGDGL